MAAAGDLKEIEEFNANCILMANLQQASTSGTQTGKAPIYDSDGSDELRRTRSVLGPSSGIRACCEALNKKNQPLLQDLFFVTRWRIEQYFLMTNYSLWEVIKNGNKVIKKMVGTVEQEYEPTSVEEKQERRNEMKARATLMMALQTKDQLKFPHIKMQSANGAIKKRNGSSMGDGHVQSSQEDYSKESGRSEHNGLKSGFDKLKVECFNCHKHGHFARECSGDSYSECLDSSRWNGGYDWSSKLRRTKLTKSCFEAFTSLGALLIQNCLESVEARLVHYKKNETWVLEDSINVLKLKVRLRDNALDVYKLNLEKAEAERDQLKQTLEKFQNSSKSLNEILECQVIDKFKKGLGYNAATAASPAVEGFVNLTDKSGSDKAYHAVPPPLTGNFIPRKPDLTFIDEIVESENLDVTTVVTPSNVKTVADRDISNTVESNAVRMDNTRKQRKSTTGGCQFLGNRLISWQCKKQTVVATSTTEAEYVAAASCCGQVLWIQNQLLDYGYNFMNTVINIDNNNLLTKGFDAGRFQYLVSNDMGIKVATVSNSYHLRHCLRGGISQEVGDEAVHKKLGDRMERAATTASSLEAEQDSGSGPRCQDTILGDVNAQTRFEITSIQSIDPPLSRGYTLGSGEDSMKLIGIDEIWYTTVI
ncbi:ribonuclease H-like domain-containing protein [Tanacetum coccineum]